MHFTALLLSGLALLATTISALPTASATAFLITNLNIQIVKNASTTLQFTIYDPDPLTNATQVCTGKWASGTAGYPQVSYQRCGNSTFAWNMDFYTSIHDFVLGLEHTFKDPAIGKPPYDQLTLFGRANVTSADLLCIGIGSWLGCEQSKVKTITAPIYAVSSKRR